MYLTSYAAGPGSLARAFPGAMVCGYKCMLSPARSVTCRRWWYVETHHRPCRRHTRSPSANLLAPHRRSASPHCGSAMCVVCRRAGFGGVGRGARAVRGTRCVHGRQEQRIGLNVGKKKLGWEPCIGAGLDGVGGKWKQPNGKCAVVYTTGAARVPPWGPE